MAQLASDNKKYVIELLFTFLLYFITAYFGLKINPVGGFATLVWAPSGIAIATLLLRGTRLAPAIFLAAFAINITFHAPVLAALGIAVGNTSEAVVASLILQKFDFNYSLKQVRDVVLLVLGAALASTLISALIGTSTLILTGVINMEIALRTGLSWWVGDMLGCLVVTPLILSWSKNPFKTTIEKKKVKELTVWVVAMLITSTTVFINLFSVNPTPGSIVHLIFPLLIWSSIRFSQRINITTVFSVNLLAIFGTVGGSGPFNNADLSDSLLLLQIFMAVLSVTTLVLTAIVAEKEKALSEVVMLNKSLEERISEERRVSRNMLGELKKVRLPKEVTPRNEEIKLN